MERDVLLETLAAPTMWLQLPWGTPYLVAGEVTENPPGDIMPNWSVANFSVIVQLVLATPLKS